MLFLGCSGRRGGHSGPWQSILLFYLLCGGGRRHRAIAIDPSSRVPMVGASGAIAGVMGAYLGEVPKSRVVMLFWFFFFFTFDLPPGSCWSTGSGSSCRRTSEAIAQTTQGRHGVFRAPGRICGGIVLVYTMGTRQP